MECEGMNALIENARNVVFDVGRVLLSFEADPFIRQLMTEEAARQITGTQLIDNEYWRGLDGGTLPEEEVARGIAGLCGRPALEPQILRFIQHFQEVMEPLPPTELIPKLHAMGKRVYVLSNYGVKPFARTEARFSGLFSQMDGMVVSGREQVMKPDPRIYRLLLERYRLKAEECVFIDDREDNIAGARAMGMKGIVYTGIGDLQ